MAHSVTGRRWSGIVYGLSGVVLAVCLPGCFPGSPWLDWLRDPEAGHGGYAAPEGGAGSGGATSAAGDAGSSLTGGAGSGDEVPSVGDCGSDHGAADAGSSGPDLADAANTEPNPADAAGADAGPEYMDVTSSLSRRNGWYVGGSLHFATHSAAPVGCESDYLYTDANGAAEGAIQFGEVTYSLTAVESLVAARATVQVSAPAFVGAFPIDYANGAIRASLSWYSGSSEISSSEILLDQGAAAAKAVAGENWFPVELELVKPTAATTLMLTLRAGTFGNATTQVRIAVACVIVEATEGFSL